MHLAKRRPIALSIAVTTAFVVAACTTDAPTNPAVDVLTVDGEAQFAKQPAPPASGTLNLCKQGGAGILAGQPFTFQVILGGVMRTLIVNAGTCVELEVPRESTPSSKGYFQNKPAAVTRLVPGATTLHVDGNDLTSAQLAAILSAAPNVSASSSLLLNLAQQLIAADLNVLRGAQPTVSVMQAMAEANAALQISIGANISLTTALDPSALSPLVNTLAAFNEGKTKLPATPLSVDLNIVELLGSLTELTSIDCAPATRCSGVNILNGEVTATVESGATTAVAFTNVSKPVLRVCKVAGRGITEGRVFQIGAGGINIPDGEVFNVPAGQCREAIMLEGSYSLGETGTMVGLAVSSISCDPAAHCTDVSLGVGAATVAVPRGITTVTFTNRSTLGVVNVCKVAGAGIATGRVFDLWATGFQGTFKPGEPVGANLQVPAGQCREATLLEGVYDVGEPNVPAGVAVSAISCVPSDRCVDVSLSVGLAKVRIVGASTTTVTVTNRSTLGTLRFCKVAGPGIEAGRIFTMFATSAEQSGEPTSGQADVPAGQCREITLLEGWYGAVETGPTTFGTAASSIVCEPSERCSSVSLGVRHARTQIVGGSTTTVTFTNRSTIALLRLCKAVGGGVNPGTVFTFNATGINTPTVPEPTSSTQSVPAGECRDVSLYEGLYDVAESVPTGMVVTAISCLPAERCSGVSLAVGIVKVTLIGGSTTEVRFTNAVVQ